MADISKLHAYFAKLGLDTEIATMYVALCQHGPQTIAGLMRYSGVERTRIYRLRRELERSGLFVISLDNKREMFSAAPIENMQILLSKKEEQLHQLQAEFGQLQDTFGDLHARPPQTYVELYRGTDGIKQMLWNQTHVQSEGLCILHTNMQNHTGGAFFDRWVRRCNERGLRFRGIVDESFLAEQRQWYKTHHNERLEYWDERTATSTMPRTAHSTVIFGDTIMHYGWSASDTYGIEMYNPDIARMQQHFFETLWQQAAR